MQESSPPCCQDLSDEGRFSAAKFQCLEPTGSRKAYSWSLGRNVAASIPKSVQHKLPTTTEGDLQNIESIASAKEAEINFL
ncbi:hypothetical protein RHMOL_Rhmol04G0023300 [Rhododendron molle]|uniref:Uncharacterized protein n=1 Tax=Rhododendron molle TaxID=49168 RepID=A0ACC0NXY7_RHOML|nr:hypothetical protein RHMOL_Rhmol04G0023300 [Rhododendron molle]